MKDRSTVTTTASPPTPTANVPSSPARIQKHGGHTPATIQTAKPTPTQVSVPATVELIDTSATVESSNVESTTKGEFAPSDAVTNALAYPVISDFTHKQNVLWNVNDNIFKRASIII